RMGHRARRTIVQTDGLDTETRTAFWNVIVIFREIVGGKQRHPRYARSTIEELLLRLWARYFKSPIDDKPSSFDVWQDIKEVILRSSWVDAFDLVELLAKILAELDRERGEEYSALFADTLNDRFEQYLVGYRFINNEIVPIDSNIDIDSIDGALSASGVIPGAHRALERAVELLADRESPDYANSVKEAISAVEAVINKITGQSTLGGGLKQLSASGVVLHPALVTGWSNIYGWASDENGVRHGGVDAASIDQAMAKYMLVTCSAFVAYLIEEGRKAGRISEISVP
ncbi:AbiJ-NTD4 domain-containing protein, partial [Brevibacterium casei]